MIRPLQWVRLGGFPEPERLSVMSASNPSRPPVATELALKRAPAEGPGRAWLQGLVALLSVYVFISAINLMGHGLKLIASDAGNQQYLKESVFSLAAHPLAGLCIGVLLTSLVQSSSFTTSFVVGLVAAGQIDLSTAIPIVMGANIGTSVKTTLVSLINMNRRLEFRRCLVGAVVHDYFNILTVLTLLPLEIYFGIISRPAGAFAQWLGDAAFFTTDPDRFNIVKMAVEPISKAADWLLMGSLGLPPVVAGAIEPIIGVLLLFTALVFLVKMLHGLMRQRLGGLFSRTLFRNKWTAFSVGLIMTAAVQSSSVTVSLMIPLAGAGILTVRQIFPYTLGANIGTTVTALMAGLAAAAIAGGQGQAAQMAGAAGLGVAFGHLLFNIYGTCVWWPLQWVPIALAKGYGKRASRRRAVAGIYVISVFFLLPLLVILLVNR